MSRTKKLQRLSDKPKPVIKRWWRRRMLQKGQALARYYMRRRLPRMEKERVQAIEKAFEVTKHYAIKNENGNFPGISTLFNIGLYLMLAERDIQALKIDALTHPNEWTRKLHARIILLTIYEWDADKVSGQALKEAMDTIQISPDLKIKVIDALRALRTIKEKIRKRFAFVRNAAIGHRDPNALIQYRAIRDLSVEDVFVTTMEFYIAAEQFMNVLTQIVQVGGTFPALLRQWKPDNNPNN